MAAKTKVTAEEGRQDVLIIREFDLPLELLFKAYVEPEFVEQWMNTKVIRLESKPHGSYRFETTDPMGNIHSFHGVIHEFLPHQRITRTFEMANTPFPVQLEFLEFEALTDSTSRLSMLIIYKSPAHREQMLRLPFAQGINLAHNRLQNIFTQLT